MSYKSALQEIQEMIEKGGNSPFKKRVSEIIDDALAPKKTPAPKPKKAVEDTTPETSGEE